MKILLLEDDLALGGLIKEHLEQSHDTLWAKSASEGVAAYEKTKFDMLLLDVNLPDGDGFGFLKELREYKDKTPAIFITSASGAKEVMEFFVTELNKRSIDAVVTQTGCMGYCFAEPTVEITLPGKEPIVFGYVDVKKADEIIERYIKEGELVDGIIPQNYNTI